MNWLNAPQRVVPLTYGGVFGMAGTVVASKPLDVPAGGGGGIDDPGGHGDPGGHVEQAGFLWQQLHPTASNALRMIPTNALRNIIWTSPH